MVVMKMVENYKTLIIMNKTQKLINTILGLVIGVVASAIYIMTAEPTVSWLDCGEDVSTTAK
jgi:hypothetical protein